MTTNGHADSYRDEVGFAPEGVEVNAMGYGCGAVPASDGYSHVLLRMAMPAGGDIPMLILRAELSPEHARQLSDKLLAMATLVEKSDERREEVPG